MKDSVKVEKEKAVEIIQKMFKGISAEDMREDLNQIFYGYISSEQSDSQRDRMLKSSTYLSLVDFLTKVSNLNTINSWNRLP